MMRICLTLMLGVAIFLTGCGPNATDENEPLVDPTEEPQTRALGPVDEQYEQLREQGIYFFSAGTDKGDFYMTVLRPDQRTVEQIQEIMGRKVMVLEEKESFFIRGRITEITPGPGNDNNSKYRHGTIFIEDGSTDSETEKVYVSILDYTQILQPVTRHGQLTGHAVTLTELAVGQLVEVWVIGPVLLSDPPQVCASKIKISN